ncbi:MAG TPA: MFS transporter, partial [Afifellaceae bacterium]|nr:MFS transporter [Afifellaceae bacterium]
LGTTFGVGLAFGPIVAGALTGAFGWRAVFLSAAVVGALAVIFGGSHLKESRDPDAVGFDWPGAAAFTAALTLFTCGIIQGPTLGWTSPLIAVLLMGSVATMIAFVAIEKYSARPMLDLSLFRYARFVGVQMLPIATCYCYVVLLVVLPLRFIGIEQHSEFEAGLMMLALSAPMLLVPFGAALLTRWISAGLLSSAGLFIAAGGLIWLGQVDPGSDVSAYVAPMLMTGVGTGFPWGLMDGLSVSVVPKERAGMATGIFSTTRVAGEGIALAIVSAFLSILVMAQLASLLPDAAQTERTAAALRLATGDAGPVFALAGPAGRAALEVSYGHAFTQLLNILAGITALSALVVLVLFRNSTTEAVSSEPARKGLSVQ